MAVSTAAVPEARPPRTGRAAGPCVLVVVADEAVRAELAERLAARCRVLEAADGPEALEVLAGEAPALVLCGAGGEGEAFGALALLRQAPATCGVPVVVLLPRGEAAGAAAALRAGASDTLGLPCSPEELWARVDAQLAVAEAAARAAHSERLATLGLLSTGFAHEVRNPLNGLLHALPPLRELLPADVPEGARAMLQVLEECSGRLLQLSQSLLAFARPAQGGAAVDVGRGLESALRVLAWRLPPGVVVERDFAEVPPLVGDAGALNQVWLNLVDNALWAMGPVGTLRLSARRVGPHVVVRVADTGGGIPPEVQARLFQPFVSTRPAGSGTGLGLPMCRRLVLAHGGDIRVMSHPGVGTTVEVLLPLLPPAAVAPLSEESHP